MTKQQYIDKLKDELNIRKISDCEDILSEYEQHFCFKLADGYSEEEIAAKLGEPKTIADQFEQLGEKKISAGCSFGKKIILAFVAFFEGIGLILFFAFAAVMAAAALAAAAVGGSLILGVSPYGLIPAMPYGSALILGISALALAVLFAACACYCIASGMQMIKASIRWQKNKRSGNMLPSLPLSPQYSGKTRRRFRKTVNIALLVFGASFVLGLILSQILAGSLGFWHKWNWFEG